MSDPRPKNVGLPPRRRMRHDRHYVDELVTPRTEGGFGFMIPVTRISSNRDQPRSNLGKLDDLVASIRRHGILEPLLVRSRPSGDGYELVSGERRFHAAMMAGLAEVPCIELEIDDPQALEIALIENLQRKDLSPFEEAEGFATLIGTHDYTHEQVAEAVGRSRVTVTETLTLQKIPKTVRNACRHADIRAKSTLLEIAKAPDESAMLDLVREIAEEQIDRAELRRRRKPGADAPTDTASPNKPFVIRFRASDDRPFGVSLSFRTETEPEPKDVIDALKRLIAEIEAGLG